jgi:LmbE family N-acetylglucosaminyl deacetylase
VGKARDGFSQVNTLSQLLAWTSSQGAVSFGSVLIVAAHPDDETIGAGGHLRNLPSPRVLFVTNGAPENPTFAARAGFEGPEPYAAARRQEAQEAMAVAGIPPSRIRELGVKDQQASFYLSKIAVALCSAFQELRPAAVFTHSYEGGHPDHDATAFGVRAACALLAQAGETSPALIEFTSYHASVGGMVTANFIWKSGNQVVSAYLTGAQRETKRRMFAAYLSQKDVLAQFATDVERFRPACACDFTQPPHSGKLNYENFDWGINGEHWRSLAAQALRCLGLAGPL